MRTTILTLLFFHLIGVVASCGRPGYEPIGPVTDGAGRTGGILVDLTASTNCADVGEQMTFQVQIQNPQTSAVTVIEPPTLMLSIRMLSGESGSIGEKEIQLLEFPYPADFQLTFQPGEIRTYLWNWDVEIPNAPEALEIKLRTYTKLTYLYGGVSEVALQPSVATGIGQIGFDGNQVIGMITCADMRKTATPNS